MAEASTKREAKRIDYDDVDEVIGLAARMSDADRDRLRIEDLERVGAELDIPPEYVHKAVTELRMRREHEALVKAKKRRQLVWANLGISAILLILGGLTFSARSSLAEARVAAERQRSQWESVIERRTRVEARYADLADSAERRSELAGADNRVSIEQRRYDERASEYNAISTGLFARIAAGVFGLPARMPLSNESAPHLPQPL